MPAARACRRAPTISTYGPKAVDAASLQNLYLQLLVEAKLKLA